MRRLQRSALMLFDNGILRSSNRVAQHTVDVTGATVAVVRYGVAPLPVSTTTSLFRSEIPRTNLPHRAAERAVALLFDAARTRPVRSGGANCYCRMSPRAILSATQPRIPNEPTRRAPAVARNTRPDLALPGTERLIAGGVHGERPAPAPSDYAWSGGPRGPLPAAVSYREPRE